MTTDYTKICLLSNLIRAKFTNLKYYKLENLLD